MMHLAIKLKCQSQKSLQISQKGFKNSNSKFQSSLMRLVKVELSSHSYIVMIGWENSSSNLILTWHHFMSMHCAGLRKEHVRILRRWHAAKRWKSWSVKRMIYPVWLRAWDRVHAMHLEMLRGSGNLLETPSESTLRFIACLIISVR